MEQLFSNLVAAMHHVPTPLIYAIAALWMGLESAGIGVPIEPMMLFIGSLASPVAGAIINPVIATLASVLGCLAFASLAYKIGKSAGTAAITRYGRFIGFSQQRAEHVEVWLRNRGALGVFIARETPMVRTFGSYIMGAADVPLGTFTIGTLLGSLLYCGVFITIGAVLGYERPLQALDAIGWRGIAIVVGVVIGYIVLHQLWGRLSLWRIKQHARRHQQAAKAAPAPSASSASPIA